MNDDQQDLDSAIHRAKVLTWVCVALFVVLDVVGLTATSQSDPRFVLGAFGGAAFFLGLIAASVWWAYLASQRRARGLDDRLDDELGTADKDDESHRTAVRSGLI
ncbi:hypothetical protein O6R08_05115 [Cutibacterium equinum]|uniref:Uncharacterized protein n=1 Tax=Cutibacterium equinum TaxID=3016342 RepID=A0ABY7R1X1_9ACTN|nr:hypothetical protein [Cutibacterium equinum]WCC80839.1 hypothetical protein O6R08_05115 [Cutibacterium equinum]